MYTFGNKSESALMGVHPDLVRVLREALKDSPVDFSIAEGVRSTATQAKYYSWGRTVVNPNTGPLPGKPFGDTNTRADGKYTKSNHQVKDDGYGHAVDLYPFINGAIDYNDVHGQLKPLAQHIKATAQRLGVPITWGGDWTMAKEHIVDPPHFELK